MYISVYSTYKPNLLQSLQKALMICTPRQLNIHISFWLHVWVLPGTHLSSVSACSLWVLVPFPTHHLLEMWVLWLSVYLCSSLQPTTNSAKALHDTSVGTYCCSEYWQLTSWMQTSRSTQQEGCFLLRQRCWSQRSNFSLCQTTFWVLLVSVQDFTLLITNFHAAFVLLSRKSLFKRFC